MSLSLASDKGKSNPTKTRYVRREDLTVMLSYLRQERFIAAGFTRKVRLPKPDYSNGQWQFAIERWNQHDQARRSQLMKINIEAFEHPEMLRVYGAITYLLLCQAPNGPAITTNKLIKRWSRSVTIDGRYKDTEVHGKYILPVWQLISCTDEPYTKAFIREPGFKDPSFPKGIATKLLVNDLTLLP